MELFLFERLAALVSAENSSGHSTNVAEEAFILLCCYLKEIKLIHSHVFRYKGQAPDLLGKQDSVYEGKVFLLTFQTAKQEFSVTGCI